MEKIDQAIKAVRTFSRAMRTAKKLRKIKIQRLPRREKKFIRKQLSIRSFHFRKAKHSKEWWECWNRWRIGKNAEMRSFSNMSNSFYKAMRKLPVNNM